MPSPQKVKDFQRILGFTRLRHRFCHYICRHQSPYIQEWTNLTVNQLIVFRTNDKREAQVQWIF